MKILTHWVLFSIWMVLLTSCALNENYFLLLPDPDGKVGKVEITNKGGAQVLSEPDQAVTVGGMNKAPGPPFKMEKKQITELFGEALSAQPDPPLLFTLYFKKGSSDLTEESEKILPQILEAIKKRKATDISVVGHTDRVGPRELNFKLGMSRASSFRHRLVYLGIDPGIIEVTSHGEDNPLVKTADEVVEPRNRRIEVVVR